MKGRKGVYGNPTRLLPYDTEGGPTCDHFSAHLRYSLGDFQKKPTYSLNNKTLIT